MKLELGKKYLTRDGRVARVICVDCSIGNAVLGALALVSFPARESIEEYDLCGETIDRHRHLNDLISEYHEPIKLEFWATSHRAGTDLDHLLFHEGKPSKNYCCDKIFRVTAEEVKDETTPKALTTECQHKWSRWVRNDPYPSERTCSLCGEMEHSL